MLKKSILGLLSLFAFGAALLFIAAPPTSEEKEVQSIGIAKNRRGEELYKEVHHNIYENGELKTRKTEFFDKDGNLIGELESDFSHSKILPDYHLISYKGDEEEILKVNGNDIEVKYRAPGSKDFETKTFSNEENMVSGYGVGEMISENIKAIAVGNVVHMHFLPVPRLDHYPMRAKKADVKGYEQNPKAVGVVLELDAGLLSMLIPSAEFVYDKETGRLLYYHGPTNMVSKSGARPDVWITYTYPE